MAKQSKRMKEIAKKLDKEVYTFLEAIDLLKSCPHVKFDESVEISMKLGVDPRKADQNVRGVVTLPHGTGKTVRVLVLTTGDKVDEALAAGADFAGSDEYIQKISNGWTNVDVIIATPDMMRDIGKLGKILGPRGLMPTPKAGTVTTDVTKAVEAKKGGQIEFKVDKSSVVNTMVGKLSFDSNHIEGNINTLIEAIYKAKPASQKGLYIKSCSISSTMGPGLKIQPQQFVSA